MPEMGFGVEETFQRFFLTLTPMFFLDIKLLGGPPDCFFLDHLEEKCGLGKNSEKCFALGFFQVLLNSSGQWWGIKVGSLILFFSPSEFLPTTQVMLSHKLIHVMWKSL